MKELKRVKDCFASLGRHVRLAGRHPDWKQFLQSPFVVQAAGATKKVQKKVQSTGKNLAKGAKRNLPSKVPSKPKKAVKKAAGGGGADSWYGPDRALFLGEESPAPLI